MFNPNLPGNDPRMGNFDRYGKVGIQNSPEGSTLTYVGDDDKSGFVSLFVTTDPLCTSIDDGWEDTRYARSNIYMEAGDIVFRHRAVGTNNNVEFRFPITGVGTIPALTVAGLLRATGFNLSGNGEVLGNLTVQGVTNLARANINGEANFSDKIYSNSLDLSDPGEIIVGRDYDGVRVSCRSWGHVHSFFTGEEVFNTMFNIAYQGRHQIATIDDFPMLRDYVGRFMLHEAYIYHMDLGTQHLTKSNVSVFIDDTGIYLINLDPGTVINIDESDMFSFNKTLVLDGRL